MLKMPRPQNEKILKEDIFIENYYKVLLIVYWQEFAVQIPK